MERLETKGNKKSSRSSVMCLGIGVKKAPSYSLYERVKGDESKKEKNKQTNRRRNKRERFRNKKGRGKKKVNWRA